MELKLKAKSGKAYTFKVAYNHILHDGGSIGKYDPATFVSKCEWYAEATDDKMVGKKLESLNFLGVMLEKCTLVNCNLKECILINCTIDLCTLEACKLERAELVECKIKESNINDSKLSTCITGDVDMYKCNLKHCTCELNDYQGMINCIINE